MIFDLLRSIAAIIINIFGTIYNLVIMIFIPKKKRTRVKKFKRLKVIR